MVGRVIQWDWGEAEAASAVAATANLIAGGKPTPAQWANLMGVRTLVAGSFSGASRSEEMREGVLRMVTDCELMVKNWGTIVQDAALVPAAQAERMAVRGRISAALMRTPQLLWQSMGSPPTPIEGSDTGFGWAAAAVLIAVGVAAVGGLSYCTVQALPVIDRALHRNATAEAMAQADGQVLALAAEAAAFEEKTGEPHPMTDEIKTSLANLEQRQKDFQRDLPEPAAAPESSGWGGAVFPLAMVAVGAGVLYWATRRPTRAAA
jgi:hypothetical protein